MTLCFTVDVEDWLQSSLDFDAAIGERCVTNTEHMLRVFERLDICGTWFVQGLVAQTFPKLVASIADAGHEVACHAHTHRPLFSMTPSQLRTEISTSRKLLEDVTGKPVIGFRAPDFSLGEPCENLDGTNREIFRILVEEGFGYDSSVVPARMRRYGVRTAPREPFRLREGLVEIPLSTAWLGRRLPALGGGYLRLFPMAYQHLALLQAARAHRPAVVYLHPYELNASELDDLARSHKIRHMFRWSQQFGRGSAVEDRIARLRATSETTTMEQTYRSYASRADLQVL